jgi:hypothetical protein
VAITRNGIGTRCVDQQQVGEHRPETGGELAGLLVVDARAHEVGRHQVRRELDAPERAVDGLCQRLHGERLGQSRHALDQQVPLRERGHQHPFEEVVLSDDHLLHLVQDALHRRGDVAVRRCGFVHASSCGELPSRCPCLKAIDWLCQRSFSS